MNTPKILAVLVLAVVAGSVIGSATPTPAFAQTTPRDLQAIIANLQAQIAALQAQISQNTRQGQRDALRERPAPAVETNIPVSVTPQVGSFDRDLYFRMRDDSGVADLQEFLTIRGLYNGPANGNFFILTLEAVKKFQKEQGINPTGYFGPKTRAAANKLLSEITGTICQSEDDCGSTTTDPSISISGISGPTTLKVGETGTWKLGVAYGTNTELSYRVIWGDEVSGMLESSGSASSLYDVQKAVFTHAYRSAGTYQPVFYVRSARGGEAKASISVAVFPEPSDAISIKTSSNLTGAVGQYFRASFGASGGQGSYSFSLGKGNVPPGLALVSPPQPQFACRVDPVSNEQLCPEYNVTTVWLQGTPTTAGTYRIWLEAKDRNGNIGYGEFTVTITDTAVGQLYIEGGSSVGVGQTIELKAFFQPAWSCPDPLGLGITCAAVMPAPQLVEAQWASSNKGIAYVYIGSSDRLTAVVSGVSSGTATIKALYNHPAGGSALTATSKITVGSGPVTVSYSVEPSSILMRGQKYDFQAKVTSGQPNAKVLFFLQRPDGTMKYNGSDFGSIEGGSFTNFYGYWYASSDQLLTNDGLNGIWTSWVTVGGIKSNKFDHYVIGASTVRPSIIVLSPNGGETWELENLHTIRWTPYDPVGGVNPTSEVSAYLEKRIGDTFVMVGKIIESGRASIHWAGEIDRFGNFPLPGEYYVRVINNKTGTQDRSNSSFKLVSKDFVNVDMKIDGSDGPITLPAESSKHTITWASARTASCTLKVYQSPLNTLVLEKNLSTSGSMSIELSPFTTIAEVSCLPVAGIEGSAFDKIGFNYQSSVKITSPNGGESINYNGLHEIKWQTTVDLQSFSLALYRNDAFVSWIAKDLPIYTTSYNWKPADIFPTNEFDQKIFKIYILAKKFDGSATFEDKSDSPFSIVAATVVIPTLNVSLDASTPSSVTLKPGQTSVKFAQIKATAGSSPVNNLNGIQIGSDSSNASAFLTNFRVFDGATQIGGSLSEIYWGGGYYQDWIMLSGVSIPANTSKIFTVVADVKPTAPSGSVRLGIAGWNFIAPGASVVPFGTPIYGNSMTIVAATAQPSITVLSPNGGEVWQTGTTKVIRWLSTGNIPVVDITTTNVPSVYIASSIPNSGSFSWTIPTGFLPGQYRLRITPPTGDVTRPSDTSDAPFSIVAADSAISRDARRIMDVGQIQIALELYRGSNGTYPNLLAYVSKTEDVNWSTGFQSALGPYLSPFPKEQVLPKEQVFGNYLYSATNGGQKYGLAVSMESSSNYSLVNNDGGFYNKNTAYYEVGTSPSACVAAGKDWWGSTAINCPSTSAPSITVTYPNGGEALTKGQSYFIRWSQTGFASDGWIQLQLRDAANSSTMVKLITSSVPLGAYAGSFNWTIPTDISDGKYLIWASAGSGLDSLGTRVLGSDFSDAPFSIVAAPGTASGGASLESGNPNLASLLETIQAQVNVIAEAVRTLKSR